MRVIKLYDRARRPPQWVDMMTERQIAALVTRIDSGLACDAEGTPFANELDATCLVFDSFHDARVFSEQAVGRAHNLRFDLFDSRGRAHPPLLTVVHPSRDVDASPRALRRRRFAGGLLVACALAMITAAFWFLPAVWTVVLIVVGVNALMMGGRLLIVNIALRERETARQRRLMSSQAGSDEP